MSGIDTKNLGTTGAGSDPSSLQAPLTELPGTGNAQGGKHTGKTKGAEAVLGADGLLDPPVNATGEKKRTGHAALSTPPPLPPAAVRATPEHLQAFSTLNADLEEGLRRGAPNNLPNLGALHQAFANTDQSTPQGKQQAAQLQSTMSQTAVRTLSFPTSGGGLAAFLALAVGNQDKQKNLQGKLIDISQTGQNVMSKQQIAAQQEQARALEKAHKKEKALAFLKPLLAIIALVVTVLFPPSGPALALALTGAAAGFIAGGVVGGKKNGKPFDFMAGLEAAAMGAGVASLATALPRMLTSLAENMGSLAARFGAKATDKAGTKLLADKMIEASIKQGAESSTAASKGAAEGAKSLKEVIAGRLQSASESSMKASSQMDAAGEKITKAVMESPVGSGIQRFSDAATKAKSAVADTAIGRGAQQATGAISKAKDSVSDVASSAGYAARNRVADSAVGRAFNIEAKAKPEKLAKTHGIGDGMSSTGAQIGVHVVDSGSQMLAGAVQFGVDQQKANAALAEARGKIIKVIEELMKNQGDRAQDAVQGLIQGRKASFDSVETVLRNGFQANNNAINAISR